MIDSLWLQDMMAGPQEHLRLYPGFLGDRLHRRLDAAARVAAKLVKGATLKAYPGGAHGLADTSRDQLNVDLLDLIKA